MCGVTAGGFLCGTSIESIESINFIESIESVESSDYRVYRVYTVYRAYRIYSFGTRGFPKIAFSHFRKCYFKACFAFVGLFFRPRDPSKKLRHVVRINLV